MPIIHITGLPHIVMVDDLETFIALLQEQIARIKELGIKPEDVSINILTSQNKTRDVQAIVEGLFKKPKRTHEVKQMLSKKIAAVISKFIKQQKLDIKLIEVIVKTFDPKKDGFVALKV